MIEETPTPAFPMASGSNNRPLIQGRTRPGQLKRELTLWINDRATEDNVKAPDLRGHLTLTNDRGEDVKLPVSGWFRQDEGKEPRIILQSDLRHGNKLLGSVRAMKKFQGQPADGARGLRLIGDLDVPSPEGVFKLTVTGEMNGSFLDRDVVLDSAKSLGFPDAMVEQFAVKCDQQLAERAHRAVDQHSNPNPSPRP